MPKTLIQRIRELFGDAHVEAAHDDARQTPDTKVVAATIPASAPSAPKFVDSAKPAGVPSTEDWKRLNRCDYTRKSRAITVATRTPDGGVRLVRRDLETREIIADDEDGFFVFGRNR